MPKSPKKETSRQAIERALASLPAHRVGLPAKDAITAVTKGAGKYTIFHTKELDDYDPRPGRRALAAPAAAAPAAPVAAARAAAAVPVGDNFGGIARKAAKLSISTAKTESFTDLKDLIKSLTPDSKMIAHKPPIGTGATSKRVKEEDRNVHVNAYMYAASREADNDFHLIIGRAQSATPEMYMTMEVSGLPPAGSPSLKQLKAARDAFKQFFKTKGGKLPVLTYDYYHPPVPVQIDASLFFDMTHAKGPHPGPPSLKNKMPTIWEAHSITNIVLK
jgi:hypothetical protein